MQKEIEKSENLTCAECNVCQPEWVSLNLGVFICKKCAKFHEKLSIDRCHVVPVQSYTFSDEEVKFISSRGNKLVNQKFEKYLPKYYHRPDFNDPPLIREQFIKAKYDREEFQDITKQDGYNNGSKTGTLFKRGKDSDKFLRRKFVLSEPDGLLEYYIKYRDRVPKDTILVRNLVNVYLTPEKIGNSNGMQITYEKDGIRRNLYVFGNDGKSTIDWYHAIRASMVKHKYQTFSDEQMKRYLNTKIIKEGWMCKTGPKRQERFRKRWFSLVGTMIWYYTQPLDAHPINYIPLGSKTFGYGIKKGVPQGVKVEGYGLTIHTPERVYALTCANIELRDLWTSEIQMVLQNCTTSWLPLEESEQTVDNQNSEQIPESNNPSSFSTASTKYRPGSVESESGSEDKENPESDDECKEDKTASRTPLFEKAKAAYIPPKYNRKTSPKRISSTRLIPETELYQPEFEKTSEEDATTLPKTSEEDATTLPKTSEEDATTLPKTSEEDATTLPKTSEEDATTLSKTSEDSPNDEKTKMSTKPIVISSLKKVEEKSLLDNCQKKQENCKENSAPNGCLLKPELVSDSSSEVSLECAVKKPSSKTFFQKSASTRIKANQRVSSKENNRSSSAPLNGFEVADAREIEDDEPKPIDLFVTNNTNKDLWFMIFQCELNSNDQESFITPWAGAKIATKPTSIGPIHIPDDIEIAIIDTAPGGFNLFRTTGPFYTQHGDLWEIDIEDEEASPEMYFHEGMQTEDGSVMVYSNHTNKKHFEIAIFKSGRKLLSRKNVKPGEAINIIIKPSICFIQVDQQTYRTLQNEDIRASNWIHKLTNIQIDYRRSKMKVLLEEEENDIRITCS